MEVVLDVENSVTKKDWEEGKSLLGGDLSPYNPNNNLVMVQYSVVGDPEEGYLWFHHDDVNADLSESVNKVRDILGKATLLIGHNLKHDLAWLHQCGMPYDGQIHDTMLFEYVRAGGLKPGLKLEDCAERRGCEHTKTDFMKENLRSGINVNEMDPDGLITYGMADIHTTEDLYLIQKKEAEEEGFTMQPAIDLMNDMCRTLTDMEVPGIKIDLDELDKLEEEYTRERGYIKSRLEDIVQDVMGDKPYNLKSPEQLSQIMYGYKFRNPETKKEWSSRFEIGAEVRNGVSKKKYPKRMTQNQIKNLMRELMEPIYKTEAHHCHACQGRGHYYKFKKDGSRFKKPTKCPDCGGLGMQYLPTDKKAGLRLPNPGSWFATANGFSGSKDAIEKHQEFLKSKDREHGVAAEFVKLSSRLNAISTYLDSVIGGIRKGMYKDVLHTSFNQTTTATARLSSTNPNCFPGEVEVLTEDGFKQWGTIRGSENLAQWDKRTREVTFTQPLTLIKYDFDGELHKLEKSRYQSNPALSMLCTADHRFYTMDRKTKVWKTKSAVNYPKDALQPQSGFAQARGYGYATLKEAEIILWCAVQADGHINKQGHADFKFQKKRKITRLVDALEELCLDYTIRPYSYKGISGQRIVVRRESLELHPTIAKSFDHRVITGMGYNTVKFFAKEVMFWDGCFARDSQYCSLQKQNADAVMTAMLLSGHTAKMRVYKDKYYIVDVIRNKIGNLTSNMVNERVPYKGKVYCATMPEGTLIVRHKGTVWFTENCQNFPRGTTFPIKKAFVSRFTGGKIMSCDLAQLEFRVAAYLSGCDKAKQFIEEGQDIHMVSARFFNPDAEEITKSMRQDAKAETFGPLYGKLNDYAEHFYDTFPGIRAWHKRLGEEAIATKEILMPSGRVYKFPLARRDQDRMGRPIVQPATQIYNYPVQGFATGDIMPAICIEINKLMKQKNTKSRLILTVHDDITADVHPEEIDLMIDIFKEVFDNVKNLVKVRFGVDIDVEIGYDLEIGNNWLEQEAL